MSKLKKILLIGIPLVVILAVALVFIVRGYQNNKTFTVTFDSNGGSEVEKQEVKLNEKVEEPEEPTKDGYDFKGWYLSGKKYDFDKKVTKDIKLKARWIKIAQEEEEEKPNNVVNNPTPVVIPTPVVSKKNATIKLNLPEVFYLNEETELSVSVTANDYKDTKVIGIVTVSDEEALEKIEYKGADNVWYELSLEETFGGTDGFALVGGTNEFKATFNKVGEYEVTVQLLNVTDKKVMAEDKATVKVEKVSAELELDLPEVFYLNEETEVSVSVVANDDENVKVIGKATISDEEALEKLEYLGADNVWYELSLEEDFGQSEGFALADGTSEFKATFNKVGEYEVTVQLINVENQTVVAETKETIKVELKPAELTVDMPEVFYLNEETEVSVSVVANDDENIKVIGKATISDMEALEKLEYLGADNVWYELSLEEDFGQSEGFALVDGTSEFKATFNKVGEYEVTVQLINVENQTVVAETKSTIKVELKPVDISFTILPELVVNREYEFTGVIEANDYAGKNVIGKVSVDVPEALEKLEYKGADDNWYELSLEESFGGEEGFDLADSANDFKVTFNTVGVYEVTVQLINIEDESVVGQTGLEISVREPIVPTIEFAVEEDFIVGQSAEFTISTEANDLEGLTVIGKGGLSNPEAIEKLEYYEVKEEIEGWYELPAGVDFGGAGFPLADATSKFRVTFKTAGTYTVNYAVYDAETNEVVASNETEIVVADATQTQN